MRPGADMAQILAALDRYPYGCIEQVSSTTRGLIFREESKSADMASRVDRINEGLEKIQAKQNANGAFGYWNRNGSVFEEFQPYAVETLMLGLPYAEDPESVRASISKGLEYLLQQPPQDLGFKLHSFGLLARGGYDIASRARYSIDVELFESLNDKDRQSYKRLNDLSVGYWLADILGDQRRLKRLDVEMARIMAPYLEVALEAKMDQGMAARHIRL